MMLAARGIFLAARRKPKLPYDAEVAYLQSSGMQRIDTGVYAAPGFYMEAEIQALAGGNVVFGSGVYHISASKDDYLLIPVNSAGPSAYSETTFTFRYGYLPSGRLCNLKYGPDGVWVDGVSKVTFTTPSTSRSEVSLYLFGTHGNSSYNSANVRFGHTKMYDEGGIVRDFVPVRFTNEQGVSEGAMYDRAGSGGMNPDGSPRTDGLYRNRGTGVFTIGPDKTA